MSEEAQEKAELAGWPADILGRLEPGVERLAGVSQYQIVLASIAISLKRIADHLNDK